MMGFKDGGLKAIGLSIDASCQAAHAGANDDD
jgi:hypothetical protein